jgi:hypothetical protein
MHGFAERGGEPPPPHEDERIFAEERWFSVDRQADAYVELLKATSRAQYCSLIRRRSRKIENRKRARSALAFSGLFYLEDSTIHYPEGLLIMHFVTLLLVNTYAASSVQQVIAHK